MSADAVALFGTAEPPPERRLLRAGPLTAILEEGNLRTISFGGVEAVRAVNYLARDSSWGTYKAALSNIAIEEGEGAFSVAYDALCSGPDGRYAYRLTIRGESSGRLVMEAVGEALTDFPTNRTGFVVLHPSEAAGGRLTIRHSDGQAEDTVFPEAINPDQPAFDIAALTHEPAPGLVCTVDMEGDAFEMEDQRNWADASFKTYIRPLSKPRPYLIAKGARDVQRISIAIEGQPPTVASASSSTATLALGEPAGRMPSLALFVDSDESLAGAASTKLSGIAQEVIVRFDLAVARPDTLVKAASFARSIGAELAVEAIFDARDPAAEAARIADALREAGVEPSALLISPRREFKTRPSNSLPDGEAPIATLVDAVRAAGLKPRIGAGTPSFFTEFNRNPPVSDADFVFFSIAAVVHAADDVSVMETLSAHPALVASARQLCPGKPVWLGPCTIGARHNPYGAGVTANPSGERKPMAGVDPRHGALFGAAFMTGVAAQAAASGVERLILAAPTGPFGLLDAAGRPYPIHAVHAELAAAAGAERIETGIDHPGLAVVAWRRGSSVRALVANLTAEAIDLRLPQTIQKVSILETDGFRSIAGTGSISLGAYRTVLLVG